MEVWKRGFTTLVQWLWPRLCCLCGQSAVGQWDVCPACLQLAWANRVACPQCAMPQAEAGQRCGQCLRHPRAWQLAHAAWLYAAPVDALVRRCKFHQDLAAGRALAHLMLEERPHWLEPSQVLVPVPLHRQRLRERGHDQARDLVRVLSRATGLAWRDVLRRERATQAQSSLPLDQRRRNMRRAFQVCAAVPTAVVLVDDVMTSGATLEAAAQVLRRAGASDVRVWVAARTP